MASSLRALGEKRVLKLLTSALLLTGLLFLADPKAALSVLQRTDPLLLAAAFLLYLAGQALSAVKWKQLTEVVGFQASIMRHLRFYFTGIFFNAFGLGTVGGDVVRALYLSRFEGPHGAALNTVVADRASGLLVLLAFALTALLLFRKYDLPTVVYWPPVLLCATVLAGWQSAPLVLRLLPTDHRVRRFYEYDLVPYWNDRHLMLRVAALSAVFHLSQIAVLILLAAAIGLTIPLSYFFVFGPLVNIFSALPISWNGLGVREGGYLYFLGHIGISGEQSIVYGLLWLVLLVLSGAVGGLVVFMGRHEVPDLDSEQPAPVKSL